ncbi:MAG: LacI family DNA-binding transcriptional regulator, partial [Lentisphaeria bacterium]|nr:LacI family DNA-binding transcriptional regulator [Lentisphaeria bacterium]
MKTVRMIAQEAGVSPATVSRILNGSAGVSREKRDSVLKILKEAGLSAPVKRSGKKRLTRGTIGVILLPGSEHDPGVILRKLSAVSAKLPRFWDLSLLSPEILPHDLTARHLRGDLAGLLLIGHDAESTGINDVLDRIPHVWLNSYRSSGGAPSILMGNEFAGRIAARHLLLKDCKAPVCLAIPSANPGFNARLDG